MASTTADALLFRQPDELQPESPVSDPTPGDEGAAELQSADALFHAHQQEIYQRTDRMFARLMGVTFGGKRDLYEALGYDRQITIEQYRETYRRGGIAKPRISPGP